MATLRGELSGGLPSGFVAIWVVHASLGAGVLALASLSQSAETTGALLLVGVPVLLVLQSRVIGKATGKGKAELLPTGP